MKREGDILIKELIERIKNDKSISISRTDVYDAHYDFTIGGKSYRLVVEFPFFYYELIFNASGDHIIGARISYKCFRMLRKLYKKRYVENMTFFVNNALTNI